ncbi:MAG: LacI family transcriptional regulator [Opitutus sp.]|nr:LacI family transcriptional regulator [Opitutus sp.]
MQGLPQRHSLVGQAVVCLNTAIAAGQWREWLPAERTLCDMLQVSRSTLRRALAQLSRDLVIRAEHGEGNRILRSVPPTHRPLRSHDVALLVPEPLEHLRPTQTLWIDELRAMLGERGCQLHVMHGQQYFRARPGAALDRLVRQHPHGCWILMRANAACQLWFTQRKLPCLVAGSCHAGVDLPSRDLDHRAACRHAAGVLLGLGHRNLAIFAERTRFAGDIESEAGFLEAVNRSRRPDAKALICPYNPTTAGIMKTLRQIMSQRDRPTALVVPNAFHYLTVLTGLAQMGWRVPEQVSLISRDEDLFLSFLVPEPARYVTSPHEFARALLLPVIELLEGAAVGKRASLLMPKFVRGASIGVAPKSVTV